MLEEITQKVDGSAVQHPNGEKVAGSFADRPTGCGGLSGDRAGRSLVSAIDKCAF
jgi:hypothetical protein